MFPYYNEGWQFLWYFFYWLSKYGKLHFNKLSLSLSSAVATFLLLFIIILLYSIYIEASRGAEAQSMMIKPTGCGFDPHSRRWNIYLHSYFHFFALVSRTSAALSSATQHAMQNAFWRHCVLSGRSQRRASPRYQSEEMEI